MGQRSPSTSRRSAAWLATLGLVLNLLLGLAAPRPAEAAMATTETSAHACGCGDACACGSACACAMRNDDATPSEPAPPLPAVPKFAPAVLPMPVRPATGQAASAPAGRLAIAASDCPTGGDGRSIRLRIGVFLV